MSTLRRALAAGALVLPLTLGSAGIASADSFSHHHGQVGPNGASSQSVQSNTHGQGGSSYHRSTSSAGPDGVSSSKTRAETGGGEQGALSSVLSGLSL